MASNKYWIIGATITLTSIGMYLLYSRRKRESFVAAGMSNYDKRSRLQTHLANAFQERIQKELTLTTPSEPFAICDFGTANGLAFGSFCRKLISDYPNQKFRFIFNDVHNDMLPTTVANLQKEFESNRNVEFVLRMQTMYSPIDEANVSLTMGVNALHWFDAQHFPKTDDSLAPDATQDEKKQLEVYRLAYEQWKVFLRHRFQEMKPLAVGYYQVAVRPEASDPPEFMEYVRLRFNIQNEALLKCNLPKEIMEEICMPVVFLPRDLRKKALEEIGFEIVQMQLIELPKPPGYREKYPDDPKEKEDLINAMVEGYKGISYNFIYGTLLKFMDANQAKEKAEENYRHFKSIMSNQTNDTLTLTNSAWFFVNQQRKPGEKLAMVNSSQKKAIFIASYLFWKETI